MKHNRRLLTTALTLLLTRSGLRELLKNMAPFDAINSQQMIMMNRFLIYLELHGLEQAGEEK